MAIEAISLPDPSPQAEPDAILAALIEHNRLIEAKLNEIIAALNTLL
jgi:hypothetical protein